MLLNGTFRVASFFLILLSISSFFALPAYADISNATPDVQIGPNVGSGEEMGSAVVTGDFNDDGYDDLAAGAYCAPPSCTGKTYVYYGNATATFSAPNVTLAGETAGDNFGISATSGDVNNDGYDDLMIGAPAYGVGNPGRVYIYYGLASGIPSSPDVTLDGESGALGNSIASGDFNQDGYDDLVAGAHTYNSGAGRAYIYYGSISGISAPADVTLDGESNSFFGYSLGSAEDLNTDGYDEVVVGAFHYSSDTGRAYVYYGSSSNISTSPDVTLTGENISDNFGRSSSAGDVNNDGYGDLIIGADGYSSGTSTGRAYVYYGSSSGITSSPNATLDGENASDRFGYSMTGAGDINHDGYDDIVIGAEGYPSGDFTGRAYLFYGGASGLPASANITFASPSPFSELAGYYTPLTQGDLNNDGEVDLIIGAPGTENGDYDGAVYLYLGTPQLTPTPSSSSSSSSSSGGGAPAPNCPDGFTYCSLAGNHAYGVNNIVTSNDGTTTKLLLTANPSSGNDVYATITKQTTGDLITSNIPFPWQQGYNTVSEIYNFQSFYAFNGLPLVSFDNPVTVILTYDPQKLGKRSTKQLRIAYFDTKMKRWRILAANTVVNPTTFEVANTTKILSFFVVVYPR